MATESSGKRESGQLGVRLRMSFEHVANLGIDINVYILDVNGQLVDRAAVWFRSAWFDLNVQRLRESLIFVGPAVDLASDALTEFGLFHAYGFHEAVIADISELGVSLDMIPEAVWRTWLAVCVPSPRNELLWNSCGQWVAVPARTLS